MDDEPKDELDDFPEVDGMDDEPEDDWDELDELLDADGMDDELEDEVDEEEASGAAVVVVVPVVAIALSDGFVRANFPQFVAPLENNTKVPDFAAQINTISSCAKKR